MCGAGFFGGECRVCGIIKLTPEQQEYYETRKTTRHRLDLRGKELHVYANYPGRIIEIEEGLTNWWVEWQDQPDEILVDDVAVFIKLVTGVIQLRANFGVGDASLVSFYQSKYSIYPIDGPLIPVFENV